jgi:formylglycine-generating enzyme required for sulfatase activity
MIRYYRAGIAALVVAGLGVAARPAPLASSNEPAARTFENSIGMRMVRIPAGSFQMGNDRATDPKTLKQHHLLTHGDYDEAPVHDVLISRDFYIGETEVTVDQFQQFRQEFQDAGRFTPYVTGISHDEAVAFCKWLTARERQPYRLPTEAEWEYAARAGSSLHFSSSDDAPPDGTANGFGIKNMHGAALEWVADWYGPYRWRATPQADPVGPAAGWGRVVRGGGPQGPRRDRQHGLLPFYRRSANRASAPPIYQGMHTIGFRVVMGEAPRTVPDLAEQPFPSQFLQQTRPDVAAGPPADRPWFRVRPLLPIPPENMMPDAVRAAGLDPGLGGHNHSAGITVAPNGDVLVIAFTALTQQAEYQPSNAFIVTRRRFGSEQWDMPAMFMELADVQDASALLWTDGPTIQFFGGGVGLSGVPFRWTSSDDSGATWTPLALPFFDPPLGGYSPQPISSAFRTKNGTMHVAIDGNGPESLLVASRNEGRTWFDVARDAPIRPLQGELRGTRGRHTLYAVLDDGSIFAIGGKESDINGFMPQFRSTDGGKTWTETASPFPALGGHQRPALTRLRSGRLFFASDWQHREGKQPAGVTARGTFVALSDDGGRTWRTKTLPGGLPHEAAALRGRSRRDWAEYFHDDATLGYAVATQGPDGLIHLITSMTHPSQEYELNEAWILSDEGASPDARESTTVARPSRYLLDGTQTWKFPNGRTQYEVTYRRGVKVGKETLFAVDGGMVWQWDRGSDGNGVSRAADVPGRSVWTQFWPNGQRKHQSSWRGMVCDGPAAAWLPDGAPAGKWEFRDGGLTK